MTYFKDMALCQYSSGVHDSENWSCPLFAVGWHDIPNKFSQGGNFPYALRDRIAFLRFAFSEKFPAIMFRGYHECSFCLERDDSMSLLYGSHINLFIPDKSCIYLIPGRVDHYLEYHSYQLPITVENAIMNCPDPRTEEYKLLITRTNKNAKPPLFNT